MKKSLIIFSALLLLLTGCNKAEKKEEPKKLDYKKEITINVGEEVPSVDKFFSDTTSLATKDITWSENMKVEENKIYYTGAYVGTIMDKNDNKYEVKVIVEDKEAPVVDDINDIEITVGDNINIMDKVSYKDNSKDNVDISIKGSYDTNKTGSYNITVEATDKSGNVGKTEFKLIVKAKPVASNSNSNTSSNSNSNKTSNSNSNKTSNSNSNKPTTCSIPSDLTGNTSKGYKITKSNGIYYINGILIANKTYPLPKSYNPGGMTSAFMTAYNKMKSDYDKQGFKSYPKLSIKSGFRSYATQNTLYNNYVKRDGKAAADRYSARPGHSEHQTGLAADFNVISDTYGNTDSGKWLANNCWKYGFILRYPKGKESKTGYMYESWHFRYIGDVNIAKTLYNNGSWLTLEEYFGITSEYHCK